MTTYRLKHTELPLDNEWDVIVVGGGPAGCAAAISAAREGAKTLLVEATGVLGGMGTSGLVPAWACFAPTGQETEGPYRGLAKTIFEKSKKTTPHVNPKQMNWTPINAEALKRIYDEMVTEAGAQVLFHTQLATVEADPDGEVSALVMANKSGLTAYHARVYVDCTGDADLAVWAGAEHEKGDESGEMQPVTHCCVISNVDLEAFKTLHLHHSNPESPGWDMAEDEEFPLIKDCGICVNVIGPGTVGCNALHQWRIDNTDPASTSHGLLTGRRLADQFHRALQKCCPDAFGNSYLVTTGALLGIRETRRIIGDYVLSFDDYKARRSFPDEVLRSCQMVDIHPSEAEVPEAIKNRKEPTERYHYRAGESHGVPYRCLTPRGLKNVLVAGRCISTDRIVQGSIRTMPVCLAMGEAAGIAAAMAAATGDVHAVNSDDLRDRLKRHGAYLPDVDDTQPSVSGDGK